MSRSESELSPGGAPRWLRGPALVLGRSLFPFAALGLLLGTLLWGPWPTLVLAALWWRLVTHVA